MSTNWMLTEELVDVGFQGLLFNISILGLSPQTQT
jgi:hypothetical protein